MFTLKFKKSKSKNYSLVEKLASSFYQHYIDNDIHIIKMTIKEIFEKWDYFNLIFWKSIDWVGSTFGYDGYEMQAHEDKTRLFYALQQAHNRWICLSEDYLRSVAPIYFCEDLDDELRAKIFNEKNGDIILDLILAKKNKENYLREYLELNFNTPLRLSDFEGRGKRMKKIKD